MELRAGAQTHAPMLNTIATIGMHVMNGLAYVVDVEAAKGSFVIINSRLVPHPAEWRRIPYTVLASYLRHPDDYPVWAPYADGTPSPWGKGQPTPYARAL